jgi:hypothetical protein
VHDDILQKIDATLDALFPPDPDLTDDDVERLLDGEIDHEAPRPTPLDLDLVHGIVEPEVVFVERATARWIESALPRLHSGGLDWEDDIPWVQRDQETLLPADIVERYGTHQFTALDGPVIAFRATDVDAIVEELAQRGAGCERDDELVRLACFG